MKNILTILFLTACLTGFAQAPLSLKLAKTINGNIKDFTTDNLGNIYIISTTNQVKKINAKGDSIAIYNDIRRYGKMYSIDATNPLKVLIYFKEFSTIVVLDRLLNTRNTIDLRKQNILQVTAVTTSYDNNIWLFDEIESKIKKIDENGNVIFESTDFRQAFDSVPTPVTMFDKDGQLYMYDPRKGLYLFDYYGAKKNNYQLYNYKDLQVLDKNSITARDSSSILHYKPQTLELVHYSIAPALSSFIKTSFNRSRFYGLTKEGILEIYDVVE